MFRSLLLLACLVGLALAEAPVRPVKRLSRHELEAIRRAPVDNTRDIYTVNFFPESCCTIHFNWTDDGQFSWPNNMYEHYEVEFYDGDTGDLLAGASSIPQVPYFNLHVLEAHRADFHAGRDYVMTLAMGTEAQDKRAIPFHTPDIPPVSNLVVVDQTPTTITIEWEPFHFDGCEEQKWWYIVSATHDGGIGPHSEWNKPIMDCDVSQQVCRHTFTEDVLPGHHYELAMRTVYDVTESGTNAYVNTTTPLGVKDLTATVDSPCRVTLQWDQDFAGGDFLSLTVHDDTTNQEMEVIPLLSQEGANTYYLDVLEREKLYFPGHTYRAILDYGGLQAEATFSTLFFPQVDLKLVYAGDYYADIRWHPFHYDGCIPDNWEYVFHITHDGVGNPIPDFPIKDCDVVDDVCVHRFDGLYACSNHEVEVHAKYRHAEFSEFPWAQIAFKTTYGILRAPHDFKASFNGSNYVHLTWVEPDGIHDEHCGFDETFFYKVFCEPNKLLSCLEQPAEAFAPSYYLRTTDTEAYIQLQSPYAHYSCHVQAYSRLAHQDETSNDHTGPTADYDLVTTASVPDAIPSIDTIDNSLAATTVEVNVERPNCMNSASIFGINAIIENLDTGETNEEEVKYDGVEHPDQKHYIFKLVNLHPGTFYKVTAQFHTLGGYGELDTTNPDAYVYFRTLDMRA